MWVPVRIQGSENWYAMCERTHLVCGPAGLTREQADNWCRIRNRGGDAPTLPGRLNAIVETEADTPHIVPAG